MKQVQIGAVRLHLYIPFDIDAVVTDVCTLFTCNHVHIQVLPKKLQKYAFADVKNSFLCLKVK